MAISVSIQYNGVFLPDIILLTQGYYHRGTHFKCCGRGFVFVAYETTILYLVLHVVESPYGSVVKRKCISLHQLQCFNAFCVLDFFFFLISLIADGPHHYHPARDH